MSKELEELEELNYNLSLDDIKSSGYVVDTLEASLWVLLDTDTYKKAIIGAINLGNDTDTIGAICGSMAGIIYGYATNKVKQPNLTGRSYWNFVQTDGAVIAGDMPSSSKEAIGRIFDGGITFWHNGDNVGNYAISTSNGSINNPIV